MDSTEPNALKMDFPFLRCTKNPNKYGKDFHDR